MSGFHFYLSTMYNAIFLNCGNHLLGWFNDDAMNEPPPSELAIDWQRQQQRHEQRLRQQL